MRKAHAALLLVLVLVVLFLPTRAEERLTDAELTELLFELTLEDEAQAGFLVLPEDYTPPVTGLEGTFNLLIIGVDTDRADLSGRSDTMVLACLDARNARLSLISFMRDLYVTIPGKGHNKLNAAYAYGGAKLLKRTLETVFEVRVDGYVAVNFSGMIDLVDALGGVELTIADNELKPLNGILEYYNYLKGRPSKEGRLASAGTQLLTGLQTMSYARIRKVGSDFERVKRQQRVLTLLFEKLTAMGSDKVGDFVLRYLDSVGTDIPLSKAISLMVETLALPPLRIDTLSIPVKGAYSSRMIRGTYFIVPNLKKNVSAIHDLLAVR